MKKILILIALAASANVMAQSFDNVYAELGYAVTKLNINNSSGPKMAVAKLGYNINDYVAIEGLLGTTLKSGHFPLEGVSVGAKLNMYGAYVKAKMPVGNKFDVFAKVGVVRTKTESDVLGEIYSSALNNFSYGVGVQYYFNKSLYGQLDYMSYYNAHGTSISGPALAVGFKF